jgi:hypothetical protein
MFNAKYNEEAKKDPGRIGANMQMSPLAIATPVAQELEGGLIDKAADYAQTFIAKNLPHQVTAQLGSITEAGARIPIPLFAPEGLSPTFQYDVGPGDVFSGTLPRLYEKYPEEFAEAGFTMDPTSDLQVSQLQSFAATDNGAAFISAVIFDEFRKKYQNVLVGASPEHVAEAFSSYYRGKQERFREKYHQRLQQELERKAYRELKTPEQFLRTVHLEPLPERLWPKGEIGRWTERAEQLKNTLK